VNARPGRERFHQAVEQVTAAAAREALRLFDEGHHPDTALTIALRRAILNHSTWSQWQRPMVKAAFTMQGKTPCNRT
jgi:hypothetical protein